VATQYVDGFEKKWVVGERDPKEPLVGTADLQSLADLKTASRWSRACVDLR